VAYARELRSQAVNHLSGPTRRRGDVAILSRALGVSRRTLHLWLRARERQGARRAGRPRVSEARRRAALCAVTCLYRQGLWITWRNVRTALGERFPTRLVQEATARFKRLHARHRLRHRARQRVKTQVHAPDVIWGLDGTHVGRTRRREPVEDQLLRDGCSRRTLAQAVGRPASGEDLVLLLEHARRVHGRLPLVFLSDNAPNNTSEEVARYLEQHQVIRLLTLPYTPQHNAMNERANREVKERAELGKGVVLETVLDAAQRLARAANDLDHHHARPVLRGRTAAECYRDPRARATLPDRDLFYRTTRHALDVASRPPNARARRRAQREAIYASLERFGLVSRTRGGVPFRAVMCVGIS